MPESDTTFTTFYRESKQYMGYDGRDFRGKVAFWLMYPEAWFRFQWYGLVDWYRERRHD